MCDPVLVQRNYYRTSADQYDRMHNNPVDSHAFALAVLVSMIDFFEIQSILDVGSGTGRALLAIRRSHPAVRLVGVEPSPEMRSQGHTNGLAANELIDGDAQSLSFGDESFDLVCEFGALHHIPKPRKAVREMLRVARKGIFISDSNNFGQGSLISRCVKQAINAFGFLPVADLLNTRERGYML